jgi:metal transporter CNNM
MIKATVPVRANLEDIKQHLKHLGPSNPATNPNKTRSTTVKIKPGSGAHLAQLRSGASAERASEEVAMEEGDETTRLLRPELSGKDGIQALGQQSYGSVGPAMPLHLSPRANDVPILILEAGEQADKSTQTSNDCDRKSSETATGAAASNQQPGQHLHQQSSTSPSGESASSTPTGNTLVPKRPYVRSGSITENIIESGGVRKVVLEMASSTDEEETQPGKSNGKFSRPSPVEEQEDENADEDVFVSPFSSSSRGEGAGSYAEAAAKGASQGSQEDSANTGSGEGKKKNNRRKKRKGGRA